MCYINTCSSLDQGMEGGSLLLSHPGLPLIVLFSHKMLLNIKRSLWHFLLTQPQRLSEQYTSGKKDVQINGLPSNPQSYLLFANYKMIVAGIIMGFFHMSFSRDSDDPMQPFNVLWSSASLPHSPTLSLVFYFYDYSNFPLPNQYLIWPLLLLTKYLDKNSLERVYFCWQWAHLKQVLAMFIILANKDKFKEIRGQTWQSTGCSCWPSCAMILNWSITSKTQLFSTAFPSPAPLSVEQIWQQPLFQKWVLMYIYSKSHACSINN